MNPIIKNCLLLCASLFFSLELSAQCDTPTGLNTTDIASTSVTLNWNSVTGATHYRVRYRIGNNTWAYVDAPSNTLGLSGLLPGTEYRWQVRAFCAPDESVSSIWSGTSLFTTTGVTSCDTPVGLGANNITTTSATLFWDAVTGASFYRVRYRIGNGSWTFVDAPSNTLNLTGLEPGTQYKFDVRAFCTPSGSVASNWSSSAFFQTAGAVACEIPTGRTTNNITYTSATLNWDAMAGAVSYSVRYRFTNEWIYVGSPTNSLVLNGLIPDTQYRWEVRSICTVDESVKSPWSGVIFFNTLACVNQIANNAVSNITDNSATITWDAVPFVDGYKVVLGVKGSGVWDTTFVATNSFSPSGLYSGTSYRYEIAMVCVASLDSESLFTQSPPENRKEFKTTGPPACPVPTGLANASPGDESVELNWNSLAEATGGYDIAYRVVGANSWIEVPAGTNSLTLTGLYTGMPYESRVRAVCQPDHSLVGEYSTRITYNTTGTPACAMPVNLSTTNVTSNSATTNWDPVAGAVYYNVRFRASNQQAFSVQSTTSSNHVLANLQSGTEYRWQVRTICTADTSLISVSTAFVFFTTSGETTCVVPQNRSTSDITTTTATLNWDEVSSASNGYRVRYRPVGGQYVFVDTPPSSTANFIEITGLTPGTQYQWGVRSMCAPDDALLSDWSANLNFTTEAAAASLTNPDHMAFAMAGQSEPVTKQDEVDTFTLKVSNADLEVVYAVAGVEQYKVELFDFSGRKIGERLVEGKQRVIFDRADLQEQRLIIVRVISKDKVEAKRFLIH